MYCWNFIHIVKVHRYRCLFSKGFDINRFSSSGNIDACIRYAVPIRICSSFSKAVKPPLNKIFFMVPQLPGDAVPVLTVIFPRFEQTIPL